MPKKRHSPAEIVAKLRQVDVLTVQGQPIATAVKAISVTEQSFGTSYSTANSSTHSEKLRC